MNTEKNNAEATTAQLDALFSTDTVEKKTELKVCDMLAYLHLVKVIGGNWENGRSYDGMRHFLSTRELNTLEDYEREMRFYFTRTDNWKELQAEKERRRAERKAREEESARKRAEKMSEFFGLFN